MGTYKNKQAVKSLLLTGVVLVAGVVVYMSWIGWYTNKYKNMENTYIRCIIENVISQYPDFDMEEVAIILNKSYSELESSTTSEEFDSILRKNGITDNTFYIKDMSDIRNTNIIVSTLIIGAMSVLFIICFYIYLRKRKNAIVQLQDYMDKISRGNYELEINDNSEDELSSLKNSLYKIMVYMKEQADSARIKKVMLAQSVSDISHQLKTPLTSTQVLLDNLNDNPDMDYATRKKFIYEALNQVNGMSWMIVTMLKLSRIDAGVVEFNNENISINKIVEEAVEAAKENAKLNNLDNCTFWAGDVLKIIDELGEVPDLIMLDPPRDGVNPKALMKILNFGVERLVYIACKPTSLARDLEMIQGRGYKVEKISGVDLFPGTYHVETVCLLSRKAQ